MPEVGGAAARAGERAAAGIIDDLARPLLRRARVVAERDAVHAGEGAAGDVAARGGREVVADLRRDGVGGAGRRAEGLAARGERDRVLTAREHGSGGATPDPVDVVTGEMFLPQVDVRLEGVLPLVLERRYGSLYRWGRCFGVGWASTLDQRVEVDAEEIHYAAPDGRVLHYPIPVEGGGSVLPGHGPRWPLRWERDSDTITITQDDVGYTLHFAPGGVVGDATPVGQRPLVAVVDRAGNRINVDHDADGAPTVVRHSGGYRLLVERVETPDGWRVGGLALAEPSGGAAARLRSYGYDAAGRLTSVGDGVGRVLRFSYDHRDRMTGWVDGNGYAYRYTYGEDGRVTRGEGLGGFLAVSIDYDLDARVTTTTDGLGHRQVYRWNEALQTVEVTDAGGGVRRMRHTRFGDLVEETDPVGRRSVWERDAFGDVVAAYRPDGSLLRFGYDDQRRLTQVVDADGATWHYDYDPVSGGLARVTDPAGAVTGYSRDRRGAVTGVTDAAGHTTHVECDLAGLPTRITGADGASYGFQRDAFGRVVVVVDPLGGRTSIAWDSEGRPLTRTLADGATETWRWDAEGNLLAHTDPAGGLTRLEYGAFDVVTARTDPDGARYTFDYDAQLRLTTVNAPTGLRWSYDHDPVGRLVGERDFNGATTTYTRDAAGQVLRRVNAVGQEVGFDYDPVGRVTARRVAGGVYDYRYDVAGRLMRATGPAAPSPAGPAPGSGTPGSAVTLSYSYDPVGRVLSESVGSRQLRYDYDTLGRVTSRTTPTGVVTGWEYGPTGTPTRMRGTHGALGFEHDLLGRETTRRLRPAAVLTTSYDPVGHLTAQGVWQADASTPGGWRATLGRGYTYHPDHTVAMVIDQQRGTTGYDLDPAGRVTTVTATTPIGGMARESYRYDALGTLTDATGPDPEAGAAGGTSGDRAVRGSLTTRAGATHYDYDAAGRLIRRSRRTLSGTRLEWHFTWDAQDHLTQVTTPTGHVWYYHYDPVGRRIGKTRLTPTGQVDRSHHFTWDGPRLVEDTATTGDITTTLTWDYTPGTFTPATQTRRSWAATAPQADIDAVFHAIVTDLVGAPTELLTPDGQVAWRAHRTLWGKALTNDDAVCPLVFPGQYRDPETGLHYNLHRYYDPDTATYATPDPLGLTPSPNPHRYVPNPLLQIDPLGLAAYEAGVTGAGNGAINLYHGTSAASAENIRRHGIDLGFGRSRLDFGRGFYATRDPAQAARWASQRYGSSGTVMQFRLPVSTFEGLSGKVFPEASSEYLDFVRAMRSGGPMHPYDYVEGPLLGNPRDFMAGKDASTFGNQVSFHTVGAVDLLSGNLLP